MPIRITCPNCRTVYPLADHLAGKTVRCKKCAGDIIVSAAKDYAEEDGGEIESRTREQIQTRPPAGPPPVRGDQRRTREDEGAPRRERRDDRVLPPALRGGRGWVLGLVGVGAALILLLGVGVLVVILVPFGQSGNKAPGVIAGADDGWPSFGPPLPSSDEAILHIDGVVDENTREAISEKLDAIADEDDAISNISPRRGDRITVLVMNNVKDVQAFSRKLDFGTVNGIEGRIITMTARKVDGPPRKADAVTKALHRLKSPTLHKRSDAAFKLTKMRPDEHRAEVVKAMESLLNDDDFFMRQSAIEALGIWGNRDTVPILLKAMKDKKTRGDTIKALGRLKDERAAEPIAEQLEDVFHRDVAAEALKQMGPIAEKAVLARLNHHELFIRISVCNILKEIGTKLSIPALEKVVEAGRRINPGEDFHVAPFAKKAIEAIKVRQ